MLDREHHRAAHARVALRLAGRDPQVLGRQRQRPAVDDLADAGVELVRRAREPSADDDDGWVDQTIGS